MTKVLKEIFRAIVPYTIRKRKFYLYDLKGWEHERRMAQRVENIRRRNKVNVLFIAMNLSMWRYQKVYELLLNDERFNVSVIINPFLRLTNEDAHKASEELKAHFRHMGRNVPSVIDDGFNLDDWFESLNPDLIFYCQQYWGCHNNILDFERNYNRLWGFVPYGLPTINENFVYNTEFHNLAWRVYFQTKLHMKTARRLMANGARNVRIVGEPHADLILETTDINPWRNINDGIKRKKVIWAPHFSIGEDDWLHHNSFLWMYDGMVRLAEKYRDSVQFAFKPHPHLYNTLCNRSDWGKMRTDDYYNLWHTMPNTQLESGEFIDLFKQSDGMIHDCGSFTGEYMLTCKPVMFMSSHFEDIYKQADDFGRKCLDLHQIGASMNAVERFIEEVILTGKDLRKKERECFFNEYLLPPNDCTVAENIYKDLVESLGLR